MAVMMTVDNNQIGHNYSAHNVIVVKCSSALKQHRLQIKCLITR